MQAKRPDSYSGNNQNDSIVLNAQSLQRGMGANMAFHTTRFDVHSPYRLHPHAAILGGLGVILPGAVVQPGTLMLAAKLDPSRTNGVADLKA